METFVPPTSTPRLHAVQLAMDEAFNQLTEILSSANSAELLAAADALEELARRVEHRQILAAAAIDREDLPGAGSRFRNTAEFLQARLRIPRSEARRRLELGAKLLPGRTLSGDSVPAQYPLLGSLSSQGAACRQGLNKVVDALDTAGSILSKRSWPQTRPQDAELLARMEESLSTALQERDPDFLVPLVKRWLVLLDQDGTAPGEAELKHRQGLFRRGEYRGLSHFELWTDALQTETLLTVLNAGNNPRSGSKETRLQDQRSTPQRQLDTLVSALTAALRTDTLPAAGGNRPQVHVIIDYEQLLNDLGSRKAAGALRGLSPAQSSPTQLTTAQSSPTQLASAQLATAQFTGPINPVNIRTIACEADVIPVVLGGAGEILDVGRKQRYFSRAQRAALFVRDQGCSFPDCTIPASWCEAHHIQAWQHGGDTSTGNGALLCSHHHHLIHQGHWTMENRQGRPEFRPPPWIDPQQRLVRNLYHRLTAAA